LHNKKITIIGAGNVGATCGLWIHNLDIADVVLVDIEEGLPIGKAFDIMQSSPLIGVDMKVVGTTDYEQTANSDIVVITAGMPRKKSMSRNNLVAVNVEIVKEVAKKVAAVSPNCIIIVVTNPLDTMVYTVSQACPNHPKNKIIGMSGVLDSARFRAYIAEELCVSVQDVTALVLGGHGDDMIPLVRLATVSGIQVKEFLREEIIESIVERTRKAGGAFVPYLKTSAWVTPSLAVSIMIEAILKDQKRVLPCSAYLTGEYGYSDIFVGVPVVLGKQGVEKIIEIELTDEEKKQFALNVEHVKEVNQIATNFL